MTDTQLFIALKARAGYRPSNFPFINIVTELEKQSRSNLIERDVVSRFLMVCKIYKIRLDQDDLATFSTNRPEKITDQNRIKALHAAGLFI